MKIFAAVIVTVVFQDCAIVSAKLLGHGSKVEATHGDSVKLSFPLDELENVSRLSIVLKAEATQKFELIARRCFHPETCSDVEKPGVSLQVEEESVTLIFQHVNKISDSGVYQAEIFRGKHVNEIRITLAVNDPPPPSISAGPTASPEPPDFHQRQRLGAVIPLVLFTMVVVYFILKYIKAQCLQRRNIGQKKGKDYVAVKV